MLSRLTSALALCWFVVICAILLVIGHGAALMVRSLPVTDGDVRVAGLGAPVTIERDALGVAVIQGDSLNDVAYGEGFAHAQDRFFQMDLLRRSASGRLSELIGPMGVDLDIDARAHRFEDVADQVVQDLPPEHRTLLAAYARGVNAGLEALEEPPFEYSTLSLLNGARLRPEPWRERDSLLVVLEMTKTLSFGRFAEQMRTAMLATLPRDVATFLLPEATRYDAPMIADEALPPALSVPDSLSSAGAPTSPMRDDAPDLLMRTALGSNNWAVAGERSAHGGAILANDMHLPLAVPNIWYRAQLTWNDDEGEHFWVGVSLPGVPGIVVGSNGHVAWGFTNAFVDVQDWIVVDPDAEDPSRYLTPDGPEPFGEYTTEIGIAGRSPHMQTWRSTRWGLVTEEEPMRVLKWSAFDPATTNLRVLDTWRARTLEDAAEIMREWRGPPQNAAIAADDGRIAWVLTGFIPTREGFDGRTSERWGAGQFAWTSASRDGARPTLIDPPDGVVWSANNRTVPVEQSIGLLDDYGLGCRAQRIREMLGNRSGLTERDLLAMQLDTRVAVGEPYRKLAARLEAALPAGSSGARAAELIRHWNGRADVDEAGYLVLRRFYSELGDRVLDPILEPTKFTWRWLPSALQEPLLTIVEQRPHGGVPEGAGGWDALLDGALTEAMGTSDGRRWGKHNRLRMRHPLARTLPKWFRLFDMPAHEQAGDYWAVRVASPRFGASERLVVSPGREAEGILHMPGGQSGNPISPHYRDGHRAWGRGEPTPLLAGPIEHVLRLVPFGSP
ncbi:MAG: penicillin acylase family protein [Phycisphaerales bacterium]|nr:penicillin acylase family protein [Phycisphaerales bacterium]